MGGPKQRRQWSEPEIIRLLKLAKVPSVRIGALCADHGISPARFRAWRREYAERARWTDDDLLLATLYGVTEPITADGVARTMDWLDHAGYSVTEVTARLREMEKAGRVARVGAGWKLAAPWP